MSHVKAGDRILKFKTHQRYLTISTHFLAQRFGFGCISKAKNVEWKRQLSLAQSQGMSSCGMRPTLLYLLTSSPLLK